MADWMHEIVRGHGTWVVAVVIFFESMGMPLPGESLLVATALYAATIGHLSIEWVVFYAAIGAIMGDNAGYLLGREVGRRALVKWGSRIGLTEERVTLGEYLFIQHGPKLVFFGRFTAFMRTVVALLAGAVRMPWPSFLLWNAIGGVCWVSLYGFGAYALGSQFYRLAGPAGIAIAVIALAVIGWVALYIRRNERRLIAEARAAMAATRDPALPGQGPG